MQVGFYFDFADSDHKILLQMLSCSYVSVLQQRFLEKCPVKNLLMVSNLNQSSATLGLDPVSSDPAQTKWLH